MARALRDLLAQAIALGSETAARDWVFAPNGDLDGITPAEAVQYKARGDRRGQAARARSRSPGGRIAGGLPGSIARA